MPIFFHNEKNDRYGKGTNHRDHLAPGVDTPPEPAQQIQQAGAGPDGNKNFKGFLRRIQYKMLLRGPSESEFLQIFQNFCAAKGIAYPADLVHRFVEKRFKRTGKTLRRCQPRDVLSHALNLIFFEKLPFVITEEILDRAFESCFVNETTEEGASPLPALPARPEPGVDLWASRMPQANNAFEN